jgi:hypothetical protein
MHTRLQEKSAPKRSVEDRDREVAREGRKTEMQATEGKLSQSQDARLTEPPAEVEMG